MAILRPLFPVAIVLLFCAALPAAAQKRNPNHTLLWRISGNGLARPSYIYGTMHVTDPRAFDFTDSVLLKLQECDAFAMEIIIDSAARQIYHEAFSPDPSAPDIRDWLDDDQEEVLDNALQRSLGLPLAQVAHARPWLLSFFLSEGGEGDGEIDLSDLPEPVEMPTVASQTVDLDAYLYRIARGEGKKVLALESIGEQLHVFDSVPFEEQVRFLFAMDPAIAPSAGSAVHLGESMITLYHKGDLDGLLATMQSPDLPAFYLQKLLTDRNHTMVGRIVPQIGKSPTFIAVGAGHLPGAEGLLQLLRQRGYTVTPVVAPRTGLAAKYREKPFKSVWTRFDDRPGAYSIELPMEPIEMPGESMVEGMRSRRYLAFDVTRGITYFVSYFDLPPTRGATGDKAMIDFMIDRMTDEGMEGISRSTDRSGGTFLLRGSNNRMLRGRIVLRGQRLHMVVAEGDWSLARTDEVDQFLSSLALLDYIPAPLRLFRSDTLQIEARTPAPFTHSIDSAGDPVSRVTVTGVASDTTSGYSYIVERHGYSRFFRAADRSTLLKQEIDAMLREGDSVYRRTTMLHNGDSAVEVEIQGEGQSSIRRVRLVQHGAHVYHIFLQMPRERAYSPSSDEFIASVRLLDKSRGDLFESKFDEIITAIIGRDTTFRSEALDALNTMLLDDQERQALYDLLMRPRADDGRGTESLRYRLIQALHGNTDERTLPMLRRLYPTLGALPAHREAVRLLLAGMGTPESISWLADLLLEEKVIPEDSQYSLGYILGSDISTTRPLFPKILPLLDHRVYQEPLGYLLLEALDSAVVDPADLVGERARLLRMTSEAIADTAEEMVWTAVTGIQILSRLPAEEQTIGLFRSLLESPQRDAAYAAVIGLLKLGDTVGSRTLEPFAAMPAFRLMLYRDLSGIDSLHLFPKRYLVQRAISESALVEWIEGEYEATPDSIVTVDTREVTVDGERRRAYMFKFRFDESEEWLVGLGSLQPVERESIDITDEHARSLGNTVGEMSIRRHLDALLDE